MIEEDKHKNKKYKIKILGEKLVVSGEISEDYIKKLAKYINEVGDEILSAYPHLPRRYLLGLTLVNITDELFKLRNNYYELQRKNKKLLAEQEKLKRKIKELKTDNEELSELLEEVDD